MWPFPNPFDLFGDAIGGVVGWAWDKVIQGIYTWFANGLLLLMEWVWNVLDTATTPRITESWFTTGLIAPLASVSVAITVAMMLMSAIQAGFGGRPELIFDAREFLRDFAQRELLLFLDAAGLDEQGEEPRTI